MGAARLPTLRSTLRDALLAACALLLVVPGRPVDVIAEEPAGEPCPTTALEASAFDPADLVIVGQVLSVKQVRSPGGGRGQQLVRVAIENVLKGRAAAGSEISVMVIGQRPTLNPEQPSVPYFSEDKLDRYVLFLARDPGQFAYRLRTLFEGRGSLGKEKIAVSQAVGRLAAIPSEEEKARRTLAALLAMSKGTGTWTKSFAARELNTLAAARPDVFDARTRARLQRMPSMVLTPDQRFWFKRLFKTLSIAGAMPSRADPGDEAEQEQDPWRATFLSASDAEQQKQMLTRLLTGGGEALSRHAGWVWHEMDPSLRLWYVRAVGEAGVHSEAGRLRRLYATEEETEIREAIVRTVGLAGGEDDLDWLIRRADNLGLRRAALLAIARIHRPAGTAFLEKEHKAALSAARRTEAQWLEYLLGETFAEAERRAGRR